MQGLEKLKVALGRKPRPTVENRPLLPPSVFEPMLYRYRKHRGVNLGSWFILERWITDRPYRFATAPGQSDLDIARGPNARELLEDHWDNWIVEDDWAWISERGMNAVRIPIGYYHLCGTDPSVLHETAFHDLLPVFSSAWSRITKAIETANRYGLGVLIDLHAAPGKQNRDPHSGTSDPPMFFNSRRSRKHTTRILCTLVKALNAYANSHRPPLANIIGIELLNEPDPSSDTDLQSWYISTIKALREIDSTIPLYLGECWRTGQYADFVQKMASPSLLVLDHHLYRCFTTLDNSTTVHEHIKALSDSSAPTPQLFARVTETLGRAGGGLVVGEWSGGLDPGSLSGKPGEQGEYVRTQVALYERYCGGWFFWTYKKQWAGDTGWSLRDSVGSGVFPYRVGLHKKRESANDDGRRRLRKDKEKDQALEVHTSYWAQYPGKYEHWRFNDGFLKGWDAGYTFLDSSSQSDPYGRVTELGFKGALAMKTTQDHGKSYWEYEHGFIQGVDAASRDYQASYCS